jgi:hypothetical protein
MRGHVTLDCKSPEPVWFGVEETIGMTDHCPNHRVFLVKVFWKKCTEEEFVIVR